MAIGLVMSLLLLAVAVCQAEVLTDRNITVPTLRNAAQAPVSSAITVTPPTPPSRIQDTFLMKYAAADGITVAIYLSKKPIDYVAAKQSCESVGWTIGRLLTPSLYNVAYNVIFPYVQNEVGNGKGTFIGIEYSTAPMWINTQEPFTAIGGQWYPGYPATASLVPNNFVYAVCANGGKVKVFNTDKSWKSLYFVCTSV